MFYQVKVPVQDQPALRFVYHPPESSELVKIYHMTVHVFGPISSLTVCDFALKRTTITGNDVKAANLYGGFRQTQFMSSSRRVLASLAPNELARQELNLDLETWNAVELSIRGLPIQIFAPARCQDSEDSPGTDSVHLLSIRSTWARDATSQNPHAGYLAYWSGLG